MPSLISPTLSDVINNFRHAFFDERNILKEETSLTNRCIFLLAMFIPFDKVLENLDIIGLVSSHSLPFPNGLNVNFFTDHIWKVLMCWYSGTHYNNTERTLFF